MKCLSDGWSALRDVVPRCENTFGVRQFLSRSRTSSAVHLQLPSRRDGMNGLIINRAKPRFRYAEFFRSDVTLTPAA